MTIEFLNSFFLKIYYYHFKTINVIQNMLNVYNIKVKNLIKNVRSKFHDEFKYVFRICISTISQYSWRRIGLFR